MDTLADELLVRILRLLPKRNLVMSVAAVSRRFRRIAMDSHVWRHVDILSARVARFLAHHLGPGAAYEIASLPSRARSYFEYSQSLLLTSLTVELCDHRDWDIPLPPLPRLKFLRINVDNEYHSDDYYRIIPRTIAAAPALEKLEIFTEPDADATCFDDDDEGVSWFHDMSTPPFPTSFLLATDSPHGLLDLLDFIWTDLCSGWLSKAEEVVIMGTVLDSTPCFPAAKRALLCFDALWEERLMECKDAMLPNAQDIVVAHDMRTGRGGIVSYSDIASLMEQRPSLKRVGYVKIGDDRVGNDGKIASFDGKLWRMRQFDPKTYFSDDSGWVEASNLDVHVFFVDYCEDRLCGCHEVITGSTYDELFSGEV